MIDLSELLLLICAGALIIVLLIYRESRKLYEENPKDVQRRFRKGYHQMERDALDD